MGCGTGSLAVLMATMGYRVSGLDLSPQMLIRAREKAKRAGVDIAFVNGDATHPGQPPGIFDVVFGRHILWTLPEPRAVLERWEALLAPMGRIVLIEGFWSTGVGMRMEHVRSALPRTLHLAVEADISRDRELWARDVTDERFAIAAIKRG
jgi:ubiquinone/menaquinone biosynthesis C-methylase UbiE